MMETSEWEFFLFADLRVRYRGAFLDTPPPRCQGLLATLLLKPKLSQRIGIANLLFPDKSECRALGYLSDRLWLLRKAYPDLPLATNNQSVMLSTENIWLDVDQFNKNIALVNHAHLIDAANLYQGDLLPSHYDDWIILERESLYLKYIEVLKKIAGSFLEQGKFKDALPHLMKLNQLEPYDEHIVRQLLTVYKETGQRSAALNIYETLCDQLEKELDTTPEQSTQALANALRNHFSVPSDLDPELEKISDPKLLVHKIRLAMRKGTKGLAEQLINQLEKNANNGNPHDAILLRIDLGIQFGEWQMVPELIKRLGQNCAPEVYLRHANYEIWKGNFKTAQTLSSEVLINAHHDRNGAVELEAILTLCEAQRYLGNIQSAIMHANKAISLAAQENDRYFLMKANYHKGVCLGVQGLKDDALQAFYEAESIAHENEYRVDLAHILNGIGMQKRYQGKYQQALQSYRKSLDLCRDLTLWELEAKTQQGMATAYDYLGQKQESVRALQSAGDIYQKTGNQFGLAENYYHLAYALPYHDEANIPQAIEYARMAIKIFEGFGHVHFTACAQAALGYNLWLTGQARAALGAFDQAIHGFEKASANDYLPEMFAYKGLANLDIGDHEQAEALTRTALQKLAERELYDIASEIYYARAMVFKSKKDEASAWEYLERAYHNLLKIAEEIDDEAARKAFFERDPTVRRLMKEVIALGLAKQPGAGVVSRHLPGLHGDQVYVKWTVDTGSADAALKNAKGSITLRRTRLARLLKESQEQGAAPSNQELADALGISTRTVQRDRRKIERIT